MNTLCNIFLFFLIISVSLVYAKDYSEDKKIEEIIVTGQKIDRDLQDTIDSISVLSGDDVEAAGIADIRQAFLMIANINSSPSNNGNNGFSIRGINSEGIGDAGGNSSPTASLVIDGAVQSMEGVRKGARGVWDISSVEVLRGPQIAFGRNALTGVVNIINNKPSYEFESSVRTVLDTQGHEEAVMLNLPMGEDFSFRLAAENHRKDIGIDYSDNNLGFLDNEKFYSVRTKLLYEPQSLESFSALLTYSRAFDSPSVSAVSNKLPNIYARRLDKAFTGIEQRINEVDNAILDLSYDISPSWKVTSVSTLTKTKTEFNTPSPDYTRIENRQDKDISQDLRFNYGHKDSHLKLVVGAFHGRYKNNVDSLMIFNEITRPVYEKKVVEVEVAEEIKAASCVNLDFKAENGGRWYEYFSDAFYELGNYSRGTLAPIRNIPSDGAWQISANQIDGSYIPLGTGDTAFPNGGDWTNIGSITWGSKSIANLGSDQVNILSSDFEFNTYAAAETVAVVGVPYTTNSLASNGKINFINGGVDTIDATINLMFTYPTASIFGTDFSSTGNLVLNPDQTFSMYIGNSSPVTGSPDWVWDIKGTYAISGTQNCEADSSTLTYTRDGKIYKKEEKTVLTGYEKIKNNTPSQNLMSETIRKSSAVYIELDWDIMSRLRLTTGFRYDKESLDFRLFNRITNNLELGDNSHSVLLPKLGLMYTLNDEHSLGAVITKGYRSGFIERNPQSGGASSDNININRLKKIEPETLINYELVYRGQWFDNRLTTNANAFYYDWSDQQVNLVNPKNRLVTITDNAGKSQVYGAELSITAIPSDSLNIGLSLGYLDTEFIEYGIFSGKAFPESPRYSAALMMNYQWFNGFFVSGDMNYLDSTVATSDINNTSELITKPRTVVNMRMGYEEPNRKYRVILSADNITDKQYQTGKDIKGGAYIGNERIISLSTQFWWN